MTGATPSGPTVVGYVDRVYAHPGDEVTLRVSVLDPARRYRAQLARLICGETGPKGPGLKEEAVAIDALTGEHRGEEQPTGIGSCAVVDGLPALGSIALSVHVWPTLPGCGVQALLSLGAVRLVLDEAGAVALVVGDETVASGRKLRARWWYRVDASYDIATGAVTLGVKPAAGFHDEQPVAVTGRVRAGIEAEGPLLMAAAPAAAGARDHFYGKLEAPVLRSGTLEARWDFSRHIETTLIEDLSPAALHGRTINAPKRAVTGAAWDGTVHCWTQNPSHYGAIHFHGDDLSDAHWKESLRFRLPASLRSGFYAVKLQASGPAFYVGFIVSPAPGAKRARLAVQASTVTYLAYANYRRRMTPGPFELAMGALPTVDMTDVMLAAHKEFGSSTYDVHRDGFGVAHATARRPLFNFRPTGRFWNFNMDLCLIDWLDRQGIEYDVISDHELQEKGVALLQPYGCVMSGSHPEYNTLEMLRATEAYLAGGGRFMYMGGNGFYWRVTFPPAHPGMIELRRAEDGTRAWEEMPGQYHHATGELGGLWRRIGRPPNALVGIGFIAQGFDASTYYRRTAASRDQRAAFLFKGIEDEILGDFGAWGDGAAGLEIDCYDQRLGSPPHALVVASSENHSNAFLLVNEEMLSNTHGVDGTLNPRVKADIVFFETAGGGAVLSTGAISFVASLAHDGYDNNISRLTRNAVDRFLDPAPFKPPGA
ncbi:MAG: N,N-dimethylformamidase [Alphaproteobacteria bacterium]|nr:N,N-dimethylformamidase [Alphaproteobacteria bacterium]